MLPAEPLKSDVQDDAPADSTTFTYGSTSSAPEHTNPAPTPAQVATAEAPTGRVYPSGFPSPLPMPQMLPPSNAGFALPPPATPWSVPVTPPAQAAYPIYDLLQQQASGGGGPSWPGFAHPAATPAHIPTPNYQAYYHTPVANQGYPPNMQYAPGMPTYVGFADPFSPPHNGVMPMIPSLVPPPVAPTPPSMVKGLSTSEVKAYTTNLERSGLWAWVDNFVYLMENKSPMLRQLLQYPVDQAHHAIAHDPGLQEANAYLARQIDCVLDPEANKVKAFKAKLANDRAAARSGVLKLAHIRRMCKLNNGAETRVAEQNFERKRFFTMNMDEDEAAAQAFELANEFRLLERCSGDVSIMFEILKKMPDCLYVTIDQIHREISRGQVTSRIPYTLDEFINIVAIELSGNGSSRGRNTSRNPGKRNANEVEQESVDDGSTRKTRCVACGQTGHVVRDCTKSCPKCGMKPCPGTYGKACVVHKAEG